MASSFDFYEKLFTKLNTGLGTYWQDVASDISGSIAPVATTLVTIYVMLWGWSMIRGAIQEPVIDGFTRITRLTVITAIALSTGYYNSMLANMLWNSPEALAGIVAGGSDSTTSMQFLDDLMSQFYDFGQVYNDAAHADTGITGIPDLSLWITAVAIWLAGILATGYAAFLLALSKMALAIILGIGPIFILLTIFEPTKRFFEAWMGQALNYVFLVLLTAGAIKLIMSIIETYLGAAAGVAAADPTIEKALPAIVFSIIGMLVMVQLPSIASALGGGVGIGTLGAVSWAYGKARGGVTAMRPTNLRRSLNKAKADYRITKSAAGSVAGAPSALYRKITGANRNRVAAG